VAAQGHAKPGSKRDWSLSESAFHRLLEWLDEGDDSGGETYNDIRRRLAGYFDRKGCSSADELADETLNRVARRLEETGAIAADAPAQYCYIVARFVFLEQVNRPGRHAISFDAMAAADRAHITARLDEGAELSREAMSRCLDHCLGKMAEPDRKLIVDYYRGDQRLKIENRRSMAARLGISPNALSIRACRIRSSLETCVRRCAEKTSGDAAGRQP
jgi:DNA-directed RNA polymerase specialized sigma24 family protein